MYYLYSENKGADQLRGYREADLRLCFRICKKPVFSPRGSFMAKTSTCTSTKTYHIECPVAGVRSQVGCCCDEASNTVQGKEALAWIVADHLITDLTLDKQHQVNRLIQTIE